MIVMREQECEKMAAMGPLNFTPLKYRMPWRMEQKNAPNVIFQKIRKIGVFAGKNCDLATISETNVSDALFSYCCYCCCYCCCCCCCCYCCYYYYYYFCFALKTAK